MISKTISLRVRPQMQENGIKRYRYSKGSLDFSQAEMRDIKGLKFSWATSMTEQDITIVEQKWMAQLKKGGHEFSSLTKYIVKGV